MYAPPAEPFERDLESCLQVVRILSASSFTIAVPERTRKNRLTTISLAYVDRWCNYYVLRDKQ